MSYYWGGYFAVQFPMGAVISLTYASAYVKAQLSQQRVVAESMHRLAHTDRLTGIACWRRTMFERYDCYQDSVVNEDTIAHG